MNDGIFVGRPSGATDVEDERALVPESFVLDQNYPNPFNPSTTISYVLSNASSVSISVYDMSGRLVRKLSENESQSAGAHEISFNADGLASGVYLYRLNAASNQRSGQSFSTTRTMTLLR